MEELLKDNYSIHWDAFSNMKSDAERISYVADLEQIRTHLQQINYEAVSHKSESESIKYRTQGNNQYRQKQFDCAILLYNKSILCAPHDSGCETYTLALANRSAVWFHQSRFECCLQDIDEALDCGYPSTKRHVLIQRKIKCLADLNKLENVTPLLEEEVQFINKACLSSADKEMILAKIKEMKRMFTLNDSKPILSHRTSETTVPVPPPLYKHSNPQLPSSSVACKVAMSTVAGRFYVATETIPIGAPLIVDQPYACVLFPKFFDEYCFNCYKQTTNVFPCRQCTAVQYCSPQCEVASWNTHHQVECQYLPILAKNTNNLQVAHLAFRMTVVTGVSTILDAHADMDDGVWKNDYVHAQQLVGNSSERDPDDRLQTTIMAYIITAMLQKNATVQSELSKHAERLDLGSNAEESKLTNLKMAIVKLTRAVLNHVHIIQSNAFNITVVADCASQSGKLDEIGLALYNTLSLANHSCSPNTDVIFYGNTAVVRAIRKIQPGDEVNIEYGPLFYSEEKNNRINKLLTSFYFRCTCRACSENWPTWTRIPDAMPVFKCQRCGNRLGALESNAQIQLECANCQECFVVKTALEELDGSHQVFVGAMQKASSSHVEDAIPLLEDHLALMDRLLCQPWKEFVTCQCALKHCYRIVASSKSRLISLF